MSSRKTCEHCGCSEIDVDQSRGVACCTNCGSVLEDSIIVAEVQFEENAHGGNSVLGQFVSLDGKMPRRMGGGFRSGFGRESREITLDNGRRKIVEVAQQLRLNQHCIDSAFNFFKMAVHRRLTRGRRHCNVIASCLYIVCRLQGTAHMLLDFSDVLQVNVYELGKSYFKLATALCINVPAMDPCLYVVRFAHRLQFGEKTHEVSMTALRLLQRMKRDWMHMGRRPSGLCGAALLVAARLHNFNRTVNDIIKVVKVCTATLRKRLNEFGDTPSSRLTLSEFMTIDLEEEQDPPAFKSSRKKAKLQQFEDSKVEEAAQEVSVLQQEIERLLDERKQKLRGIYAAETEGAGTGHFDREASDAAQFVEEDTLDTIKAFISGETSFEMKGSEEEFKVPQPPVAGWRLGGIAPTAASLGLTASIEECMHIKEKIEEDDTGILDLEGIDEAELDTYIMTPAEVKRKTELWHQINADYLQELKDKEERDAKLKEEGVTKPEKRKRKARKKNAITANSAGEAIEKMLQEKKISTKINYDVLRSLNSAFGGSATTTTPDATTIPATTKVDPSLKEADVVPTTIKSAPVEKREPLTVGTKNEMPAVVENGPVEYDEGEAEEELDYMEEEEISSTAELLRKHRGEDDNVEGHYEEDLDDYFD